jgi:DNA-binding MarR family transcriptional regulator
MTSGVDPCVETKPEPIRRCYATAMRKASRRLTALYDDVMAPAGLRSTQYAMLAELREGPVTINELGRALVMDRSAVGHSLRPLERDGLISMDKDPADRRSVRISLTDAGIRKWAEASELWTKAQERVVTALGQEIADDLRSQLLGIAKDDRLVP